MDPDQWWVHEVTMQQRASSRWRSPRSCWSFRFMTTHKHSRHFGTTVWNAGVGGAESHQMERNWGRLGNSGRKLGPHLKHFLELKHVRKIQKLNFNRILKQHGGNKQPVRLFSGPQTQRHLTTWKLEGIRKISEGKVADVPHGRFYGGFWIFSGFIFQNFADFDENVKLFFFFETNVQNC